MRAGAQRGLHGGLRALLGLVLLPACPLPTRVQALPALQILPGSSTLYLVDQGNGYESLNFALRVQGPPSALLIDGVELSLRSRGTVLRRLRYDGASLQARLMRGHSGRRAHQYENFEIELSREAAMDAMEVTVLRGDRALASRTAALRRYEQKGRYRLPVDGCWFVSSGYDFGVEHRRWYNRSHFAWDFVRLDDAQGMAAHKTELAAYRAFDQPVRAPADGVVLAARDDRPDNPPGFVGGIADSNYILIDHGQGEHSKMAHLRQGSLLVHAGDSVVKGQAIARVGNSGQSDAPHLHLHFQRTRVDTAGREAGADPLPVLLSDYLSTSNLGVAVPTQSGRPRRGEFVCDASRPSPVGVGQP